MTLSTYADLQTQLTNWSARSDLTPYYPDFITLFEAAACRKLKVRPMEATDTLTPTSGVADLPDDYLGYRRVTWTGSSGRDLEYLHPKMFSTMYSGAEGVPINFTIEGGSIKVGPSSDADLEIEYYAKTPALSGALNWLYTNHPDAYLFGALTELYAFIRDADAAILWKQRRDEVFDEINKTDFNERGSMSMRVYGITP